jgi:hypothetical protein
VNNNGQGKNEERRENYNAAVKYYAEFLSGKKSAQKKLNGSLRTIAEWFDLIDSSYTVAYTTIDMNWDGVPELCAKIGYKSYVFTFENGGIREWSNLGAYGEPRSDGSVIFTRSGGGPAHIDYKVVYYDYWGNQRSEITFSKYDSDQNGIYDDKDAYFYCDVELPKSSWDSITDIYLSAPSNNAEWQTYKPGDNISIRRPLRIETAAVTSELIDEAFLRSVQKGKAALNSSPFFDMLEEQALSELISYLSEMKMAVSPGTYYIQQDWNASEIISSLSFEPTI